MWIYEATLTDYVDAQTIDTAWSDQFAVATASPGVNVVGRTAVISSVNRVPDFADFDLEEVDAIEETQEITSLTSGTALDQAGDVIWRG